jgi:histidinol phosphatase-like PHP family hydrolase
MEKDEMTRRIINAMDNPYTTILAHPTGRLLLSRQEYPEYGKNPGKGSRNREFT